MYEKEIYSRWLEQDGILITRLSGIVSIEDILEWKESLLSAIETLRQGTAFKMLVNIHGFKAANFDAHKVFRTIIPQILTAYNLKVGYLDLFDNVDLTLQKKDGSYCYAIAHCHHDTDKMDLYETKCSRANDRYFTDPAAAENWLRNYPAERAQIL